MLKHPATPYVAPFAVFFLLVLVVMPDSRHYGPLFGIEGWEHPFRCMLLAVAIWYFSRPVLNLKPGHAIASIIIGVVVFALWIGPDVLWPSYRTHWLFTNSLWRPTTTLPSGFNRNGLVLTFRTIRAVLLVPIIEELFWRGWLMRWLIDTDFENVPIGAYALSPFLIASALFASEHGAYWEVGLAAGLAYNWWIVRTKSLADCMLAHAVTNGALSAYVIVGGQWEYWL